MTHSQPRTTNYLKTLFPTVALAASAQLWSTGLFADDTENTEQSANSWFYGVTVGVRQSPFAGGKESVSISPTRLKHGGGLRLNGLARTVYRQPKFNVYLGIGLDEWSAGRDDSAALADMDELDRAINVRAGIATALAGGWVTAEAAKDLAGAHKGMQAKLRYTANIGGSETHEIRPYVEAQWLSAELTDYYVGVDSHEVIAGRPQYTADADLTLKAGVGYRYRLSENFTFLGGVHATHYGAEISDSPIIDSDLIWKTSVGLAYRW